MGVFVYFGRRGWRAYSLSGAEDNLPSEYGPWTRFRNVEMGADAPGYDVVNRGQPYVFQSPDPLRSA
jgi:hypothetical protein